MNKRLGFAVAALSLFCYGASEAGFSRSDVDEKKTENKDAAASGGEAPAAPSEAADNLRSPAWRQNAPP